MVNQNRIDREKETLHAMVQLYCRKNHAPAAGVCDECSGVLDYALNRLQNCPYGEKKTTCLNCPIHCYQPEMREHIRKVMRFASPRMLLHHPVLAIQHALDGLRDKRQHN